MRIAFVVHDYNRHEGHSRYVAELACRYKRNHDVHIFTNTFEEPDPEGLTLHHVPAFRFNALVSTLSFVIPATLMVGDKFDIVHAQGLCGLRHNVATAHFCQPAWYENLAKVNRRPSWKQKITRLLVTPLERLALSQHSTQRVIAISNRIKLDLKNFFRRQKGVRLIYHGIDTETFHPRNRTNYRDKIRAELNLSPGVCLALFVGNLQKGAAAAIHAVARVSGTHLVLVSASDSGRDRSVAKEENVTHRVTFLPHSKNVERYFAAADVFVFPTLYEPYGMVISEAMASGLPVITPRSAGAAELITHSVDGWLTENPWDVDEITKGLLELTSNIELRASMGTTARARIEAFTWDEAARQTMAVYQEIVTRIK